MNPWNLIMVLDCPFESPLIERNERWPGGERLHGDDYNTRNRYHVEDAIGSCWISQDLSLNHWSFWKRLLWHLFLNESIYTTACDTVNSFHGLLHAMGASLTKNSCLPGWYLSSWYYCLSWLWGAYINKEEYSSGCLAPVGGCYLCARIPQQASCDAWGLRDSFQCSPY